MNDGALRKNLAELLRGGQAHTELEQALKNIDPAKRNVRPAGLPHSIWEELEHMRLAQEDILRYTLDANWQSPAFPEGYWPVDNAQMTEAHWQRSITAFFADLDELIKFTETTDLDLTALIPHGQGRTYLRQILMTADHNAYHLGQIVLIRKLLGDWQH